MSLRLTSSPTIRHHLRALASRIPHQWTTIALLLLVAVFLTLYVVNERHSARIRSELEYERVVWPQYFGFPGWYGKPSGRDDLAAGEGQEIGEESILPWNSLRKAQEHIERPVRVLGLIREYYSHLSSFSDVLIPSSSFESPSEPTSGLSPSLDRYREVFRETGCHAARKQRARTRKVRMLGLGMGIRGQ